MIAYVALLMALTLGCPQQSKLDREIGFESHGASWQAVLKDFSKVSGLPIAVALREKTGCSGYPPTRGKAREILDSIAGGMASTWKEVRGCVVVRPASDNEERPGSRRLQQAAVGSFLSTLSEDHFAKLTHTSLRVSECAPEAAKVLNRLALSTQSGADRVLKAAWDKADVTLRFCPAVDVLDGEGRIVKSVMLFSEGTYGLSDSSAVDQDSSTTDVRLVELLMSRPPPIKPTPDDLDLRAALEDKVGPVLRKVAEIVRQDYVFDSRIKDWSLMLVGVLPKDALPDVLRAVTEPTPTELRTESSKWSFLSSLADGSLRALLEAGEKLPYTEVTAADFAARKEMTIGDLGPEALRHSVALQQLGVNDDTKVQLRPGIAFVINPHEIRRIPPPTGAQGPQVYMNYVMIWSFME